MSATELHTLAIYADDQALEVFEQAAAREGKALSNYLLTCALAHAETEHGLRLPRSAPSSD